MTDRNRTRSAHNLNAQLVLTSCERTKYLRLPMLSSQSTPAAASQTRACCCLCRLSLKLLPLARGGVLPPSLESMSVLLLIQLPRKTATTASTPPHSRTTCLASPSALQASRRARQQCVTIPKSSEQTSKQWTKARTPPLDAKSETTCVTTRKKVVTEKTR
jgi:hypothetical protein